MYKKIFIALIFCVLCSIIVLAQRKLAEQEKNIVRLERELIEVRQNLADRANEKQRLVPVVQFASPSPLGRDPMESKNVVQNNSGETANHEIVVLEQQIAQLQNQLAQQTRSEAERRAEAFRNRMARLRQENPERFQELQEQRRQGMLRMQDRLAVQEQFFAGLDVDRMNAEQRQNHEDLLAMLQATKEIIEVTEENPEAEETAPLRREIFQNMRVMGDLLNKERDIALLELADHLGYGKSQAEDFRDYINVLNESTSIRSYWSSFRPGARRDQR